MDQPFETGLKLDKRAEVGDARDHAVSSLAGLVSLGCLRPRVRRQLLHAQRNPALDRVDLEHLHVDRLADRQHVGGFAHAAV